MKINTIFIATLCILLHFSACTKNNNTVVSSTPGNITGKLGVNDENGTNLTDFSGALVSIKSTNYSTTSDVAGKWTLSNVEPGTYDFIFSKPGYDSLMIFGITFAGNGTLLLNPPYVLNTTGVYNIDPLYDVGWPPDNSQYWPISKIPDVKFSQPVIGNSYVSDSTYVDSTGNTIFGPEFLSIKIPCDKEYYYATIFTSLQAGNSIYSFKHFSPIRINNNDFNKSTKILTIRYWKDNLISDYKTGDKVYIRIYPGDAGYTEDFRNGEKHWVHLGNPAPEVSFIVP